MVISEQYTLKTSNSRPGVLKVVSEFAPVGIIGVGLPTSHGPPQASAGRQARRLRRCFTRLPPEVDASARE